MYIDELKILNKKNLVIGLSITVLLFTGCADIEPKPFEPSGGHIQADQEVLTDEQEIPALVPAVPALPEPEPPVELEKYTVVVNEVPVKELLFALARDARVNVDIDPKIAGFVTINAVEQTLPQILDRIARQADIRYEFIDNNLVIMPDEPYFKTYKIDYLNLTREMTSNNSVITQISTTSTGFAGEDGGSSSVGAGNNSSTEVNSYSSNQFWNTLVNNILAILGQSSESSEGTNVIPVTDTVIAYPETGLLTVKATEGQHQLIQNHIDLVLTSANRQVMIQATIVEVSLSDQYQAGVDWSFLNASAGLSAVVDTFTGFPIGTATAAILSYTDTDISDEGDQLNVTIKLLDEFGDVRVLSSPQLMVLNNHTALLKVVDNVVFFTIEAETSQNQTTSLSTVESTVHTVPVGVVMSITPQINDSYSVILNVRPTISRVSGFALDPGPAVANSLSENPLPADEVIQNQVPQIQVREMESILRMNNRQIAVLGGLMQNEERGELKSIPGASRVPGVGEAFKDTTKEFFKTELVIFLRPVIVDKPSLAGDLDQYREFLERQPAFMDKKYNSEVDEE